MHHALIPESSDQLTALHYLVLLAANPSGELPGRYPEPPPADIHAITDQAGRKKFLSMLCFFKVQPLALTDQP